MDKAPVPEIIDPEDCRLSPARVNFYLTPSFIYKEKNLSMTNDQ
jgi:hypothetical protein